MSCSRWCVLALLSSALYHLVYPLTPIILQETDKASMDVEAQDEGVLVKIVVRTFLKLILSGPPCRGPMGCNRCAC